MALRSFSRNVNSTTLFHGYITIPDKIANNFVSFLKMKEVKTIAVCYKSEENSYPCKIRRTYSKKSRVTRLWIDNPRLLLKLQRMFILTYAHLVNEERLAKIANNTHFGEKLLVSCLRKNSKILLSPEVVKEDRWKKLLLKMHEQNQFIKKQREKVITFSSCWKSAKSDYIKDKTINKGKGVIYYIANTISKEIYIGSSKNGLRPNWDLKHDTGSEHMGMKSGWDMFRYDIINHKFINTIEILEHSQIQSYGNSINDISISGFKLVNKKGIKKHIRL